MEDAVDVFDRLSCEKDAAIYNALLSGYALNGKYGDAFLMLGRMEPNAKALSCALDACAESSSLEYGKQIHCAILRHGFDCDTIALNSLLDMYAKCGQIAASRLVFDRINEKSVVSWTGIIDAYGRHGLGREAMNLFKEMENESGVSPSSVTFLSVLAACNHSGLVEEGRVCFFLMSDKYGLDPSPEHYACYLDLLGRAGEIEEAWNIFRNLDKLTLGICVVMLNACKDCKDLARGEIVVRHLLNFDLENPGIYVLISNFYSDIGRWEGAEGLRKEIRTKGLSKEMGRSQVSAIA